jgi:hypothetical protein
MATNTATVRSSAAARPIGTTDDELPEAAVFWRWVGRSIRPVAGWVLFGIGLVMIAIGYLGVSREALVAKQLPYLVSGGILGIAVVGIGAALMAVDQMRRDSGRLDRLEAMVDQLHAVLLARPDAPDLSRLATSGTNGSRASVLDVEPDTTAMALPVGQVYHRPSCTMLDGKDAAEPVSAAAIRRRGLSPCRLCEPGPVEA